MYEAALGYEAWVKPQLLGEASCFQYRMTTQILHPDIGPQLVRPELRLGIENHIA